MLLLLHLQFKSHFRPPHAHQSFFWRALFRGSVPIQTLCLLLKHSKGSPVFLNFWLKPYRFWPILCYASAAFQWGHFNSYYEPVSHKFISFGALFQSPRTLFPCLYFSWMGSHIATALGWCLQNSELLVWLELFSMDHLPVTPSASVSCGLESELCLQLFLYFPFDFTLCREVKSSHRGKGCHTYYIYQNYKLFITARCKGSSVISPTASQRSWSLQSKTLLLGEVFLLGNGRKSWAWEGQRESLDLI